MDEELIRKWFKKRFNREPEEDQAYFEEWLHRFSILSAWSRMDDESRAAWIEIVNEEKTKGEIEIE